MKVTINGQEVALKKTFRAIIMWEQIQDRSFAPTTMTDMMLYFYCVVASSVKDITLDFDAFVEWLDENDYNAKLTEFSQWLEEVSKFESQFAAKEEKTKKKARARS